MNFKLLDKPAPPQNILESIYRSVSNFDKQQIEVTGLSDLKRFETFGNTFEFIDQTHGKYSKEVLGLNLELLEKHYPTVCILSFLPAEQEVTDWVHKNVTPAGFVGINIFHSGDFFFPHIDLMRTRAINCVVEPGGENVTTSWYKPKLEYEHLEATTRTFIPYDRINVVEEKIFKTGEWYELDVSKIHNVKHIEPNKRRITITVSL